MFAESNIVRPASRQMSTRRLAPSTLLAPHALKNSLLPPPNVPVPRLSTGTFSPDAPSCLCSITRLGAGSWELGVDLCLFVYGDRLVFRLEIRHLRFEHLCPGSGRHAVREIDRWQEHRGEETSARDDGAGDEHAMKCGSKLIAHGSGERDRSGRQRAFSTAGKRKSRKATGQDRTHRRYTERCTDAARELIQRCGEA